MVNFSNIIFSLVLPLIAFVFEVYPRILNRKYGVDIWTHLLYLKEYHRQNGLPKKIANGFLVPGRYDYPPIFILILSKFPFKFVEKYEFLFSPFFDAVHLLVIFFISYFLTSSIIFALLVQFFYVLTPIIILENSSATPRSLGYLLFTIVSMSMFLFKLSGEFWLLGLAALFGSLIFLSHRFTTQGFFFFSLFFSIFDREIMYIVVFLFSFVLALVFSRGVYLTVLKGHLGNLSFWRNNIEYRFAHQVKGNYKQSLKFSLRSNFKEHKTEDFIFKLYNQFLRFPPFVLSITNPWTLPAFYMFVFAVPSDLVLQKMLWWVAASYLLAVATIWIPGLRFLGEGQRYLELSSFHAALLSTFLLFYFFTSSFSSLALFLYAILGLLAFVTIVVIQRKAIIKDRLRTLTVYMQEMFAYLKSLKTKPKLLCIPHQITTNTIYHTGCGVFVNADYASIEKISDVYPYIRIPIKEVMKKHKLDMILLNEEYAKISDLKLNKYKTIKRIENFALIKVL